MVCDALCLPVPRSVTAAPPGPTAPPNTYTHTHRTVRTTVIVRHGVTPVTLLSHPAPAERHSEHTHTYTPAGMHPLNGRPADRPTNRPTDRADRPTDRQTGPAQFGLMSVQFGLKPCWQNRATQTDEYIKQTFLQCELEG